MTFDWTEFLKLARELQERADDADLPFAPEAAKRTAVSRAYYAAFCHARNYAEKGLASSLRGQGKTTVHSELSSGDRMTKFSRR